MLSTKCVASKRNSVERQSQSDRQNRERQSLSKGKHKQAIMAEPKTKYDRQLRYYLHSLSIFNMSVLPSYILLIFPLALTRYQLSNLYSFKFLFLFCFVFGFNYFRLSNSIPGRPFSRNNYKLLYVYLDFVFLDLIFTNNHRRSSSEYSIMFLRIKRHNQMEFFVW